MRISVWTFKTLTGTKSPTIQEGASLLDTACLHIGVAMSIQKQILGFAHTSGMLKSIK